MDHDVVVKRAQFIDKSVEVRKMFEWAAPTEVLHALKTYCSDFYGSMLWELGGAKAAQVYSAWDTAVKLAWSCPRWTRTFLLQQVLSCGMTSARTDILARYGKFSMGLRTSVCQEVRVLFNLVARDLQTTTARNIKLVRESSGLDPWAAGPRKLKETLHINESVAIPPQNTWKIEYTRSLLRQLQKAKYSVQDDRVKYIQGLIDSLVL